MQVMPPAFVHAVPRNTLPLPVHPGHSCSHFKAQASCSPWAAPPPPQPAPKGGDPQCPGGGGGGYRPTHPCTLCVLPHCPWGLGGQDPTSGSVPSLLAPPSFRHIHQVWPRPRDPLSGREEQPCVALVLFPIFGKLPLTKVL